MNENKIINYAVAIFALIILVLAIAPRISAEELTTASSQNTNTEIYNTYRIEIPCAIDRTKIVLPHRTDGDSSNDGAYKVMCNSSAYFNQETSIYHLKKNEGYYINLILNNDSTKKIDLSEITEVTLSAYPENAKTACFTKIMSADPSNPEMFATKFSFVDSDDSKEFGLKHMNGLIESCGLNTKLIFQPTIKLKSGDFMILKNTGNIAYVIIDSDNSNIVAENARNKENIKSNELNAKPRNELNSASRANEDKGSTIFISNRNITRKIMDISQVLAENRINSKNVVGDITLETESNIPTYIFEVKEQKKLLGFIPFGKEKIVEKRISAIKEIKE